MSSCEKCWADSTSAAHYHSLLKEREPNPCTPEEQAGPDAGECPACKRRTLHQYTAHPMCGCPPALRAPDAECIEAIREDLQERGA